jgi:hypothetical protein
MKPQFLRTVDLMKSGPVAVTSTDNAALFKPRLGQIGCWEITAPVYRTNIAETCIADNADKTKAAIVTYLLPSVLPGTSEYDDFESAAKILSRKGKIKFRELLVKRYGKRIKGITHGSGKLFAPPICIECAYPVPNATEVSDRKAIACPNCQNTIGIVPVDIHVPALVSPYEPCISLKQVLAAVEQEGLHVPSSVFSKLVSYTTSHMLNVRKRGLPIAISSNTILLTDRGRLKLAPAPIAGNKHKHHSTAEMMVLSAGFFGHFINFVPDPSEPLHNFLDFPSAETLRLLLKSSTHVTPSQVLEWLGYVKPTMFAASGTKRSEAYLNIQEMIVNDRRDHSPEPTLQFEQVVELVRKECKSTVFHTDSERKGESHSQKKAVRSMLCRIPQTLSFRVAAVVCLAITCVCAVLGFKNNPEATTLKPVQARIASNTLKTSPPKLLENSIGDNTKRKIGNSVATARVQISPEGRVTNVVWVYATDEQRAFYQGGVATLIFEPAKDQGKEVSTWTTVQFPLN